MDRGVAGCESIRTLLYKSPPLPISNATPPTVPSMTGQLKTFLDHMGYRWLPHRPHPQMFRKIGLAVSTAAGAGAKKVPIYGGTSFTGEYPKVTAMPKI